jgi:hypothetical protein
MHARLIAGFVTLTMVSAGCAADRSAREAPARPGLINHVVFFKLKNAAQAAELVRDCDEDLAAIPGITSYFCGRHIDTGRPTVDQAYDVGFFVAFDSEEAYSGYVQHPAHVALVEKWRPRWEWILVRDVLDDSP